MLYCFLKDGILLDIFSHTVAFEQGEVCGGRKVLLLCPVFQNLYPNNVKLHNTTQDNCLDSNKIC